jgi:hypothetical protein
MSLCDDKRHPWFGCWSTYVADSTGLTVPFDTDPSNGVATHYAISAGMWDLWNLPKRCCADSKAKVTCEHTAYLVFSHRLIYMTDGFQLT